MRMAAEQQFELGSSHQLTGHMLNIISHNTLSRREITDCHLDDPTLRIRKVGTAPQLDILLHWDVFRLPVIVLHGFIQIICPLIFQRQDIEEHRVLAVNNFFSSIGFCCFRFVEDESFIADCVGFFHESV